MGIDSSSNDSSNDSSSDGSSEAEGTAGEPNSGLSRPAGEATDTTSCYEREVSIIESEESSPRGEESLPGPRGNTARRKLRPRAGIRPPVRLDW